MSIARVNKVSEQLASLQSIPAELVEGLTISLPVIFKEVVRYQRVPGAPRALNQNTLDYRLRKAHFKYHDVLKHRPHLFLAFILAISPRSCLNFKNLLRVIRTYKQTYPIALRHDAKEVIESVARGCNVDQDSRFQEWVTLIFNVPKVDTVFLTLRASDVVAVRPVFGDRLFDAVKSSRKWAEEEKNANKHDITECATTVISKEAFQDIWVELDIGLDDGLCQTLFGDEYRRLSSLQEDAEVTLYASVSACESVLPPVVWLALQDSQLHQWEKKGQLGDITGCVQLKGRPRDLGSAKLCLRLSWIWNTSIAQLHPGM